MPESFLKMVETPMPDFFFFCREIHFQVQNARFSVRCFSTLRKSGLASNITSLSSCKAWGFFDPVEKHIWWPEMEGNKSFKKKQHKCGTCNFAEKIKKWSFFGIFVKSIRFGTRNAQTWRARIVPSRKTDIYPNLGKFGKNHRLNLSAPATRV